MSLAALKFMFIMLAIGLIVSLYSDDDQPKQ